jgi:hypothetical protein
MRAARTISFGVCLALGLATRCAASEDYPQVWLNPGFLSYHADREADFRENNIGFGAEAVFAPDHGLLAGNFINSQNFRSHYAMYEWRPLHWQRHGVNISGGLIAGVIDGYPDYHDGGWYSGVLPMLFFEGKRFGVNFTIVPGRTLDSRLVAIQLKFRVW